MSFHPSETARPEAAQRPRRRRKRPNSPSATASATASSAAATRPGNRAAAPVVAASPARPVAKQQVSDASLFAALGLEATLVRALGQEGYITPTPIQEQTIPVLLRGQDLIGCAQTGTGKTAAFLLPVLQRLAGGQRSSNIRALVLTPTRELAAQISERAAAYGSQLSLRHTVIYGGVSQRNQERELRKGPELLVATPGRLLDLMQQGLLKLSNVEFLVLDEADTMLDMGFIHAVRRIVAAIPKKRQTLLFSATMPQAIESLAKSILQDPERVSVSPRSQAAETVEQSVYHVQKSEKRALLEQVLRQTASGPTLVFTRTKRGANKVSEQLTRSGILATVIHGNKSQNARERALNDFKQGRARVLVATDIAARGIDVQGVSHVINFELPQVAESYVHRIGRTGRAGADGRAISFCDSEERPLLRDIERLLGRKLPLSAGSQAAVARAPAEERGSAARANSRMGSGGPRDGGQRDGASRDSNSERASSRPRRRRAPGRQQARFGG